MIVCLGTDSLASAETLGMLDEVRFLHRRDESLSGELLLTMATLFGAWALRAETTTGSLKAGKSADLALIDLPDRDESDPYQLAARIRPARGGDRLRGGLRRRSLEGAGSDRGPAAGAMLRVTMLETLGGREFLTRDDKCQREIDPPPGVLRVTMLGTPYCAEFLTSTPVGLARDVAVVPGGSTRLAGVPSTSCRSQRYSRVAAVQK